MSLKKGSPSKFINQTLEDYNFSGPPLLGPLEFRNRIMEKKRKIPCKGWNEIYHDKLVEVGLIPGTRLDSAFTKPAPYKMIVLFCRVCKRRRSTIQLNRCCATCCDKIICNDCYCSIDIGLDYFDDDPSLNPLLAGYINDSNDFFRSRFCSYKCRNEYVIAPKTPMVYKKHGKIYGRWYRISVNELQIKKS